MIGRDRHSGWSVSCDGCGDGRFLDCDMDAAFPEAVAEVKAAGWRIIKDPAGQWRHRCPACAEEPA